jgi:predicted homoserine dehydrogenase-like protein
VKAVFDANRTAHQADRKADQAAALKAALTSGKITQAQYDYIVTAQGEIDTLMQASGSIKDQTDATKAAIKAKLDALHSWFTSQKIDPQAIGIMVGGHGGHGGRGDHDNK